jgi:hypothetical protein
MRHWSLYDSIIHSRYVAARLGTWQDKGRDRMDELLVRMGFSQRDCKQDYCKLCLLLFLEPCLCYSCSARKQARPSLASVPCYAVCFRADTKDINLVVLFHCMSCFAGVTARKFTNLSQKLREHAETYRLKDLTFRCLDKTCPLASHNVLSVSLTAQSTTCESKKMSIFHRCRRLKV